MSTDERDALVAEALTAVAVPDHGPGFWARLESALVEHDGDAVGEVEAPAIAAPTAATSVFLAESEPELAPPVHEVVLDDAPPTDPAARRWGRRAARALLAVAAVAVVVVAGILVAQRDDTGPDLSSQPGPTDSGSPETTALSRPTTEAEQVVVDFVDALGRGDTAAAAALLGPRSEEYLDAQSGSAEAFLSEASEGFGAWSASTDRTISSFDDEGTTIVVFEGTVEQEGEASHRVDAFPVVHAESADAWLVDKWAFDPTVEDQRIDYSPAPGVEGLQVSPGDQLDATISVPGVFRVYVDGAAIGFEGSLPPSGKGLPVTIPADAGDGAALVVVFASESGTTYIAEAYPVNSD